MVNHFECKRKKIILKIFYELFLQHDFLMILIWIFWIEIKYFVKDEKY